MNLLPEAQLIWSPTVANSRMNRERNASGVNSYEQEFKFKPEVYLAAKIATYGRASWLDLCCGRGNALIQTARHFEQLGQQHSLQLTGIDLIDNFQTLDENITCVEFVSASLLDWLPAQSYDLITCVHGLHYLGDKLKVIETSIAALNPSGRFVANLDLNNLVIEEANTSTYLKKSFKQLGIAYHARRKVLERVGGLAIKFDLQYLGADDHSGPNYTGQDAVTSHYRT